MNGSHCTRGAKTNLHFICQTYTNVFLPCTSCSHRPNAWNALSTFIGNNLLIFEIFYTPFNIRSIQLPWKINLPTESKTRLMRERALTLITFCCLVRSFRLTTLLRISLNFTSTVFVCWSLFSRRMLSLYFCPR